MHVNEVLDNPADPGNDPENGPAGGPSRVLLGHIDSFSRFGPAIGAAVHTILSALFLPLVFWLVLWQLSPNFEASTLRGSVMRGLRMCLPLLFTTLVLLKAVRPGGVAECYFGWKKQLCSGLRPVLFWAALPATAMLFVYTSLETFDSGAHYDTLGRFVFIAAMTCFAIGVWSSASRIGDSIRKQRSSGSEMEMADGFFRSLFLRSMVLIPVALAAMAFAGYYFTAVRLSWRMFWSLNVVIGVAMIAALASRLLLLAQFRIKLRQLSRNDEGQIDSEETIDIEEISDQVNRLLRVTALMTMIVAGWYLWESLIPTFGYLETGVWQTSSRLLETGEKAWITIRHLLVAAGVLGITFVLSRNLPGLLEITVLDRLPLDRGGRYAIAFVLRYLVGIAGIMMATNMIGFSWTSVQYLAAGLTVGLGFGLQEIFANLISGIIILIERPVRVGDVVTVNSVTGTVTRMQLRATTIRDLDHRELIVPNKKFITEDVMNWTLSDRLSRLIFPVGVAYGSDTETVQNTLIQVANRNPIVLDDPKPQVLFKGFGSSTLDFELQVVIPARERFAEVQHDLNMMIEKVFRENGLEIAFPQQDVHVKGLEDLAGVVQMNAARAHSAGTNANGNPMPPSSGSRRRKAS